MKWLFIVCLVSCATSGRPAPTPEEMPYGREVCRSLCASVGRNYLEYRYNGDCICK